jgi:hypothetical protein
MVSVSRGIAMGLPKRVRVHMPTETIDVPGDQVLGIDIGKGFPAIAWRDRDSGEIVRIFGGAIELHEDEGGGIVPVGLHIVPGRSA